MSKQEDDAPLDNSVVSLLDAEDFTGALEAIEELELTVRGQPRQLSRVGAR